MNGLIAFYHKNRYQLSTRVVAGRFLSTLNRLLIFSLYVPSFVLILFSIVVYFKIDLGSLFKDNFFAAMLTTLLAGGLGFIASKYQTEKSRENNLNDYRYDKIFVPLFRSTELVISKIEKGNYEKLHDSFCNQVDKLDLEFKMSRLFNFHLDIFLQNERKAIDSKRRLVLLVESLKDKFLPGNAKPESLGFAPGDLMAKALKDEGEYFHYEGLDGLVLDSKKINASIQSVVMKSPEYRDLIKNHHRLVSVVKSLRKYLGFEIRRYIKLKF